MSEIEKILLEFYEENKQNNLLLSKEQIKNKIKSKSLFDKFNNYNIFDDFYESKIDQILFGTKDGICFTNNKILFFRVGVKPKMSEGVEYPFQKVPRIKIVLESSIYLTIGHYECFNVLNLTGYQKLYNNINHLLEKINNYYTNEEELKEEERLKEQKRKEQKRLKDLKESQTNVLSELDKDGNGIIDVIEGGDDFMKLFRKHQSVIKEFDKEYINHLVKISNYLKTKRSNIQEIFLEIRKTKNQSQLEENVGLLKNQIHTYEVVLFHSLSLITSIVEDDLITVNEIYEEFDKLKMFKTDHEKEVSQKLSDIGDGLSTLMYSINSMERNIVSGLNTLSYVTEEGFSDLNSSLSRELQSIDSSIQSNNLLTGIQTYQLYKINKQTKGLIE